MSVERPVSILGGLCVIAEVSFGQDADTPDGPGEFWGEVVNLYWIKANGTKGKPLPEKVFDRAMDYAYRGADIIEQVSEALAYEKYGQNETMEKLQ